MNSQQTRKKNQSLTMTMPITPAKKSSSAG